MIKELAAVGVKSRRLFLFYSSVSLCCNDNINTLFRNGASMQAAMDNLAYTYKPTTNQLLSINDVVPEIYYANDIRCTRPMN